MRYDFRSENCAPARTEILDAVLRGDFGSIDAYGDDSLSARVQGILSDIFEHEVAAFPILTGTAANALALSQISTRFSEVICHRSSHIHLDECGAVEFQNAGGRLKPVGGANGKLDVERCARALGAIDDVHRLRTTVLSLTQATEMGTFYSAGETEKLAAWAKSNGMAVHVDGTRFANAVVASGASPAELTWKAGVDVLCLGATKGGAIGAEAVIFFDRDRAENFRRRMKQSGHLPSRLWFLAAQLEAYFQDGLWLESARHANAMADRLRSGLSAKHSILPHYPVQTNMVFLQIPQAIREYLHQEGFDFYTVEDEKDGSLARLLTSYATQPSEVDELIDAFARASNGAARPAAAGATWR